MLLMNSYHKIATESGKHKLNDYSQDKIDLRDYFKTL